MKRNFWIALSLVLIAVSFVSCSSAKEEEKRNEVGKIIESRSSRELMNDLYIACDGDVESLARMLQITPSSIERLRKGETIATPDFEEMLKDVASYYFFYGLKYSKLRSVLDPEYKWYNSILYLPSHHPWVFWSINGCLLLTLVITLILIFSGNDVIFLRYDEDAPIDYDISVDISTTPIYYASLLAAEGVIFLVAWIILSVRTISPIVDNYIDTINPVIERLL